MQDTDRVIVGNIGFQTKKAGANAPAHKSRSCIQHIFYKNPIPSRRIVHQNISHSTHQFPILNDGAATHE